MNATLSTAICTVEGCDRSPHARGWCLTHYRRWQRRGETGGANILDVAHRGQPCSVAGCTRSNYGRGYCDLHYKRQWRGGNPAERNSRRTQGNLTRGATHVGTWRGDDAGYSACHSRVKAIYGSASAQRCVHCSGVAQDWAYNHTNPDPAEQIDPRGRPYSPDPARYMALCRRCHKKFDLG